MFEIARLDEQRRLQIGESSLTAIHVDLSLGSTIQLWAVTGVSGQLQILPADSELARLRDTYETAVGNSRRSWDSATDEEAEVERTLAGFFRLVCRRRTSGNKVRLTLPADVVRIGLFKTGESVAAYWHDQVLELWRQDRWQQAITVRDIRAFTQRVSDLFADK